MSHIVKSLIVRAGSRLGAVSKPGLILGLGATATFAYLAWAALPPVPVPPQNPITESKRVLGKILFWDEQLSSHNTVSCGTCHAPVNGGTDPRIARNPGDDNLVNTPDDVLGSPGTIRNDTSTNYLRDPIFALNPQITGRAANSMVNAAFAPTLFWDGRATSQFRDPITNAVIIPSGGALESQSMQPPVSSVEMGHEGIVWGDLTAKLARVNPLDLSTNIPADVASVLASHPSYSDLFQAAFGDSQITASRIAMAIATYERTLISDQTPFDRFRAGQTNALTAAQQRGLNAFQAPGSRCNVCHSLVDDQFTDFTFRNIGLRPPTEDRGRADITGNNNDRGKFKVPALRNAGLKRTFMHNGMFSTVAQVVGFYARAPGAPVGFPDNRDPLIGGINLPPGAQTDITDFISNGLTDARVRDQTFPFDRPLLVGDRPANRSTLVGGGVPGAGGVIPRMIAQAPPMVGNMEFKLGVDGVPANASARLGFSSSAPVNGRITPEFTLDAVVANSGGTATVHWPLVPGVVSGGQVLFAQWIVTDPAAAGGQSRSVVAQIPFFCGSYGCPPVCPADYNHDAAVDGDDVIAFFGDWDTANIAADRDQNGSVDGDDVIFFYDHWDNGC
ncbi:MAG: cytochrome c peroxidase [Phycisphaerales bacterium]